MTSQQPATSYALPQAYSAEMFIVRVSKLERPDLQDEFLDEQGDCTLQQSAAHLYWDVTEALSHAAIAQAQGFESDAEQVFVTLH